MHVCNTARTDELHLYNSTGTPMEQGLAVKARPQRERRPVRDEARWHAANLAARAAP